jgi:hypothetical protein
LDFLIDGNRKLIKKVNELAKKMAVRFDRIELKLDMLIEKTSTVAANLKAHRADTEDHGGIYQVKEG